MTALRISVADLLRHPGARRSVRLEATVPGLAGSAATVPDELPLVVDLVLERVPDGIVVQGEIDGSWRAQCSRCLNPVESDFAVSVRELFEPEPVEGETYALDGEEIDLDQLLRDTVLLELPLAPTCGDGGCDCAGDDVAGGEPVEPEIDPRWRVLSELDLS
ncbi:MAG: YceD family protein [Acidimicrobiia bacterium]